MLLEGDHATAITHFALMWSDILELRLVPVVEDAQLLDALGRAAKERELFRLSGVGMMTSIRRRGGP
jgi:hypothetical protein